MTGVDTNDFAEHRRTYEMFIGLVKRGTTALVVLLALMALFLVRH
ncbi:aa3-type cytochrome c oxidase subunit IV [Siculibacillus lacustris]|uniref:Aa3-type cytochrome c oxidase subunit IV n=1 Tax=Siculibacillus lacustris TaxID=1549641 RepID=A0A4Q9VJP9_9HYPH|nr:aa3-type cytochrome c oxidase subunit IV [Siculibacillus lacustris]TBW35080.1 aa3-type cytochrome c oxidase subunit IV [Siculibacillus lacustris]